MDQRLREALETLGQYCTATECEDCQIKDYIQRTCPTNELLAVPACWKYLLNHQSEGKKG